MDARLIMNIAELTSLLGLILGATGTLLGLSNYFRDRAKITVRLLWDMAWTDEAESKKIGCIIITNTGRRAIYISHVALRLPKGDDISHFLIQGGIKGQKLSEGDSPATFPVEQDGLEVYANKWQEIVAEVSDSTQKVWLSKRVVHRPSWANASNSIAPQTINTSATA